MGGRSHELRGHRHELPGRQHHRAAADQGRAAQEVQVPGVHQHRNAVRRPQPHGGAVGLHQPVRPHLRPDAVALRRIPGGSSAVQGQFPGEAEAVQ